MGNLIWEHMSVMSNWAEKVAVLLFIIIRISPVQAQGLESHCAFRTVFYNVENLFDCKDDSLVNDNEFTPAGSKQWSYWRYTQKLKSIYKVIIAAGGIAPPEIIGLCEVENKAVLQDLIYNTPLSKYPYGIVHQDSPDQRGIDVAILYRKDKVDTLGSRFLRVSFDWNKHLKTRDIAYLHAKIGQDTLHFFINHWPSRRGGQTKSEPKRLEAAKVLKADTDSILSVNPRAKIIVLGDFNDGPTDKSLRLLSNSDQANDLVNLSSQLDSKTYPGSYRYKSHWYMYDQILVSRALLTGKNLSLNAEGVQVYSNGFLLRQDKTYGGFKPYRTYQGPAYIGGYSDHLPISACFINQQ